MKHPHAEEKQIPERPVNVDDTHWEIYKMYMMRESQVFIARKFKVPVHRISRIIDAINERIKFSAYDSDKHGFVSSDWREHQAHREMIIQRFNDAYSFAKASGSKTITIRSLIL